MAENLFSSLFQVGARLRAARQLRAAGRTAQQQQKPQDERWFYDGFKDGRHWAKSNFGRRKSGRLLTNGAIGLGDSVRFVDGAIDQMPHRVREEEITPSSTPELKVAAIAQVAIGDPAKPARVGGHVSVPVGSPATTAAKVSKTGKGRQHWISGNQSLNYWWDKTQKEFRDFFFLPEGVLNPSNPADKVPYELRWLGYGFWQGDWRKIPPISSTSSTTTSGLFITTNQSESCAIEIVAIFLNSKERYPGTFTENRRVVLQKPGDPNWNPEDPYALPPPSCEWVCVPVGPPIKGVGRDQHWYYFGVNQTQYPGQIRIAPFAANLTRAEILSAYRAAYSQYGEVNCADGPLAQGGTLGGQDTSAYPYTCTFYAPFKAQEQNCTCNATPQPPPPPTQSSPPPPPDPPGLKRTEEYSLLIEVLDVKLKPGLLRRVRWEETSRRESTDGVETSKTQSRKVDCWFPLVKNQDGDAVIALQVFQDSSAATPPPLEIRYWWSPPGGTSLVALDRAVFEPIFFKDPGLNPYGVTTATPIEETKEAKFYLADRSNPVPDLLTPQGKPAYLARVKIPTGTGEDKPPDAGDRLLAVEFWSIPEGVKTVRKLKVRALRIPEGTPVEDYSYHPGTNTSS